MYICIYNEKETQHDKLSEFTNINGQSSYSSFNKILIPSQTELSTDTQFVLELT